MRPRAPAPIASTSRTIWLRELRYNYNIRAEFERDGKTVVENKTIQLTAGQTANLDFVGATQVQTADNADTRTTLIVRLPADAKLFLAGRETKASGEVREFSTTRLPNGSEWQKYEIKAVIERDGHEEVREQTIQLAAGESRSDDQLRQDCRDRLALTRSRSKSGLIFEPSHRPQTPVGRLFLFAGLWCENGPPFGQNCVV